MYICPYCGGDCINEEAVNIYLKMIEKFFKYQNKDSEITFERYPTVGEVGECKKTGERIYLCPYCKKPFKAYYIKDKVTITCPNCNETLCLPATNRTFC
jgi:DNA-directed RNA polymerase subunit RPC12/RpoP